MRKGVLLVFMNPSAEEKDREFGEWYDNIHTKEACAQPGVRGVVRYRISETQVHRSGPPPYRHLALHYLDDVDAALPALSSAKFTPSDAVDEAHAEVVVFEPVFERMND